MSSKIIKNIYMKLKKNIQCKIQLILNSPNFIVTGGFLKIIKISCMIILIAMGFVCEKIKGEFYWAVSLDSKKPIVEKLNYQASTFIKGKKDLQFTVNDTIWWIFKPQSSPLTEKFIVSISKKTVSWIEKMQKEIYYSYDDNILRDSVKISYSGCYRLRLIQERDIIDTAYFSVINNNKKGFPENLDLDDPESDEILKYSKNLESSLPCP